MTTTAAAQPSGMWWPPPQGEWTYADYLHLPDNAFRYEILAGDLHMTPAPSPRHQMVLSEIHYFLSAWLRDGRKGRVIPAPVDVRLDDKTIVQPDLVVVLSERMSIVAEKLITGAPNLLIEGLSPSTEKNDRQEKFKLYAKRGVPEYWIVDMSSNIVEVYSLRGDAYSLIAEFGPEETLRSEALPGFSLKLAEVFAY